ncbi:MAG: molybdopterin-synthase adenylyltransferase MoeB [Phaeodactylibacter sp.]|uniref:molybdopterin-synthase adenylyltransferase MoeB n=1 Tax=Phaeodactylibacter sp. TaxID=1940289 RepID=UPI0032F0548F
MEGLNTAEIKRYARHLAIPGFGPEGQRRLKQSRVLVIGAGGLGSPVLLYLAAAGVGHLQVVDFDIVEASNLQRQVLFTEADLGTPKAEAAARHLTALNPHITISPVLKPFTRENARALVRGADLVIDGTDNFPTRYLSNDACVLESKPLVYGSIYRFEGQVSVFNLLREDGSRGPNYRDLFPTPPPPELVPNCAEGGVLGVLPGIIGSLQANEAIKVLAKIGEPLDGKLYLFDAATLFSRTISIAKSPELKIEGLIDYEQFCNPVRSEPIPVLTVQELDTWRRNGRAHQLIDVREPYEFEIANLGGQLIPLSVLAGQKDELAKDRPVVIHCRSGQRSARAVQQLQEAGLHNLYNLEGGILAWAEQIDPALPTY